MAKSNTQKATEKELAKFDKDYAKDKDVCNRFKEMFVGKIQTTRQARLDLESLWLEDLRMWSCRLDSQGYQGRANLFVPELNNQVESSVEKAVQALFPNSDYLTAIPMRVPDEKRAEKIKSAVLYELEEKNKLSSLHWDFERAKILYGNGIYKVGFERNFMDIYTRNEKGQPVKQPVPIWNGVKVSVPDNFRFYVFPEVNNLRDAELVFEDSIYSLVQAKRDGIYYNLESVAPIEHDIDHQWVDATRLEIMHLSNVLHYYKNCAVFTEVYCSFELTPGEWVPVKAVLGNSTTVLSLKRNPFWFQHAPYLCSKYNNRPASPFYGLSLADKIRSQQGMINDLANQTMDSLSFIINPIAIIDPGLAGDVNSMKVMPGARWLGSPEGIQFSSFPDVSGSGLRAMQEIRGQVAQFSDNTPGIAPQLQGKARSATQASIVEQSVSARQRAQGKVEETDVLGPLAKMTHILLQQFMDTSYQIRIQGPDKGEWILMDVQPQDLVGDVDFIWRGVSEKEKNAVRSQQLLAAYNLALQTQAVMPGEVDLPEFMKLVMKDAFDIKDIDYLFNSLKQKKTVDPEVENIALEQAKEVDINPGDDDAEHIRIHSAPLEDDDLDEDVRLVILRHIEKHKLQKEGKAQLAQMKARVESLQAVQGMQGNGGPQDGRSGPQVASPMEGNQSQVASSPQGMFSSAQATNNL